MLGDFARCCLCRERFPVGDLARFGLKSYCKDHIGDAVATQGARVATQAPPKRRVGITKGGSSLKRSARRVPPSVRSEVMSRDGHICRMCGRNEEQARLDPHHVIYRSMGGLDEVSNLITLCHYCHVPIVHGDRKRWQPVCLHALATNNLKRLVRVEKEMQNHGA